MTMPAASLPMHAARFCEDAALEYDSRFFSARLRNKLNPLSEDFIRYLDVWDADEARHYEEFADLYARCFKDQPAARVYIDAEMAERSADFTDVEEFLSDEFSVYVLLAFIAGGAAAPGKIGHAGAIVMGGKGAYQSKKAGLEAAGVNVLTTPVHAWAPHNAEHRRLAADGSLKRILLFNVCAVRNFCKEARGRKNAGLYERL